MAEDTERPIDWGRRVLWGVIGVAVLLLVGLVASATVPRWWAQRIGDQVNGSIVQGTFVGITYGFVFTLLPIAMLVLVLRWKRTRTTVIVAVALALLLALPNLMTLGIVVGRGNAAHAGDRVLDVEAPAFRGGTLAGAVLAFAIVAFIGYLVVSRERTHAQRHAPKSSD